MSPCRWSSPARATPSRAPRPSCRRSGLGDRLQHYPGAALGRRAAARGDRARHRARTRRSWWPTSRPAISTRPPARQIVDLLFALKRERGATLVLVTHDLGLARLLRPHGRACAPGAIEADARPRVAGLRRSAMHGPALASTAAAPGPRLPRLAAASLRLALRELRSGLQRLRHVSGLHRARRRGHRRRVGPVARR